MLGFLNKRGIDYIPSIKDIKEAANNLHSVKTPDHYTGVLRSQGDIDKELIKSKRRQILRHFYFSLLRYER